MSKFFAEFKKFITRGNVMDMAVGVIVGSSFTAIVNAMSNNILKPIINWVLSIVFGKDSLSELFTFLVKVKDENGLVDLTQSIYIDWGAFINAIINFLLIAFVLFCIVKAMNKLKEKQKEFIEEATTNKPTRADRKAMKKQGIKLRDKEAVKAYYAEKERLAAEAKKAEEEKARKEREANPTTEDLLKQIRDLLSARNS